ncbi:GT-D fold domain-containing glycosyltransferase [Planococcus shenhongbingii]|uniref:GT-D fold domain-containing glycosyltransferase n=1 Tax=Planococcus shenhongbingii TaxID=3058398 RepID=UPI002630CB14|nr:GT-D fold domain-containing glycosyltransferase [Planococcus sp. N016]WKA57817.1 GT-D fold domain-containing glycosyltransferase [Planococcus sp. N016]
MLRKKYNLYRIKIWLKTIYYFVFSLKCNNTALLMNGNDTVKEVLKNKKSIIRFGDGEFNILSGKSIAYQMYSKELHEELERIIKNYLKEDEATYKLCLPTDFLKKSGFYLLKKRIYISSWSYTRYIFKKKYDENVSYGDAFLFAKGNEEIYKKLWITAKNVIFIHNNEKYANYFEQKYGINTKFIEIPKKNAFEEREKIYNKINIALREVDKEKLIIIVSAGPLGKILVENLSNIGLVVYDTGHCWDDPLEAAL